jgi:hypothetical protein
MTVSVQRWNLSDPILRNLFKGSQVDPNGTQLISRQSPVADSNNRAMQWTADTLRTDGVRIVITELNAPAFVLPSVRNDPPVPASQLMSIALDPSWPT